MPPEKKVASGLDQISPRKDASVSGVLVHVILIVSIAFHIP